MEANMDGKPATKFFLTVDGDRVAVLYDGTHGGKVTRYITNQQDWVDFFSGKMGELMAHHGCSRDVALMSTVVMCSSSLDFPWDETANEDTWRLAFALSGHVDNVEQAVAYGRECLAGQQEV
jgi:hypothetical protein